jgi:hypothetical protein
LLYFHAEKYNKIKVSVQAANDENDRYRLQRQEAIPDLLFRGGQLSVDRLATHSTSPGLLSEAIGGSWSVRGALFESMAGDSGPRGTVPNNLWHSSRAA